MAVLEKAYYGIYPAQRIADVSSELKKKYFLKSKDPTQKTVRVIPELRKKVKFQRLNFMDNTYPVDFEYDMVFCRNVIIYFDRDTQEKVINKIVNHLKPKGYFFLGHSESIASMDVQLVNVKPTIFRKA